MRSCLVNWGGRIFKAKQGQRRLCRVICTQLTHLVNSVGLKALDIPGNPPKLSFDTCVPKCHVGKKGPKVGWETPLFPLPIVHGDGGLVLMVGAPI